MRESRGQSAGATKRHRPKRAVVAAAALVAAGLLVATTSAVASRSSGPAAARASCQDQIALNDPTATLPILAADCYYQAIPRPKCGSGSKPETGFQGEVPLAARTAAFTGFSCNLKLVGQWQGQGASWQLTWYGRCAYYDQAPPATPGPGGGGVNVGTPLVHPGTVAVDVKNPARPRPTAYLASPGLLHPWESLKVNARRGLLAGQLQNGSSFDVYSVAKDCAHPKLLSSTPLSTVGHEGDWTPDGKTYWGMSRATPGILGSGEYHAIDVSEPTHPSQILSWPGVGGRGHGVAFSPDGMTGYFSIVANSSDPNSETVADSGFIVADVSDIQLRKPNPQVRELSVVTYLDGGNTQMLIPITINKKPYLVTADEIGGEPRGSAPNGNAGSAAGWQKACADGVPPFATARIWDISNPKAPTLVSRMTLQTDNPSDCQQAIKDVIDGGQTIFSYDTHYCSVDRRVNTTALACDTFNSGVRVYDIRNPAKPREIAYYNPPSAQAKMSSLAGSEHAQTETRSQLSNGLSADWCSSQSRFYQSHGTYYLWITCQDNGFQVLKFTNNAYPLKK